MTTSIARRSTRRAIAVLVALLAGFADALAQAIVLEVIPLRYRTVDQVLPVIQPMLAKGGTASGFQLVRP